MCNSLFYSLRYELSKSVLKYTLTYLEQELVYIYPIEYPRVPNIQTWIGPILFFHKKPYHVIYQIEAFFI